MPDKATRDAKRAARKANKKPFNETGLGKFLKAAGSTIGTTLGDVLPNTGVLGIIKQLVKRDPDLSEDDREIALKMIDMDLIEMQEVTKRLQSDNEHPVTRLVRPISYAFVLANLAILMYFDGNVGGFQLDEQWIPLIQSLAGTMTIFYFGSRGVEKIMKTIYKYK